MCDLNVPRYKATESYERQVTSFSLETHFTLMPTFPTMQEPVFS